MPVGSSGTQVTCHFYMQQPYDTRTRTAYHQPLFHRSMTLFMSDGELKAIISANRRMSQ